MKSLVWTGGFILLVLCGGCSVNGRGLFTTACRYGENEAGTGRSVSCDTWGISISTIGIDTGVTIGRTHRTYYFAGPSSGSVCTCASLSLASPDRLCLRSSAPFEWQELKPMAEQSRLTGLSLFTGWRRFGAGLGIETYDALWASRGSNLLVLLKCSRNEAAPRYFHVQEIK
jgi:hypothetical protein